MQKTLLNTKWIGALIVVAVSFVLAFVASAKFKTVSQFAIPIVMTEAQDYLPIVIQNGTVVIPQNTEIRKNYGTPDHPFWMVLDTRTDELSAADIKEYGIYLSKKYIYGVTPQKTEIRDFAKVSDLTLNQKVLESAVEWWNHNSGMYTFLIVFLSLVIYICCAVSLYAVLIYLLLGIALKISFERVLRVTTLGYMLLLAIGLFVFSFSIITTFVLLLLANYVVSKYTQIDAQA